jgi:hypothetical protein
MLLANYLGKKNCCSNVSNAFIISVPYNAEQALIESEKPHNRLLNMSVTFGYKQAFKLNSMKFFQCIF